MKETSKFDMFHRNGRSIQELKDLKGADGEFQDATPRSHEGEAEAAFDRKGHSEANPLGQARPSKNPKTRELPKHRSMMLTPKALGGFPGKPDVTDQRRTSTNVTPNYSASDPTAYQPLQQQEKHHRADAGSEWTAGAPDSIMQYENTEQKEHKAKGERMRELIER